MRTDVSIRLAQSADADVLKQFALEIGMTDVDLDWTDIYPYWLIAEFDEAPIGMIQVCPSKPIGRLEMLYVKPDTPFGARKVATAMLMVSGVEVLKGYGAQYVSGVVSFKNKRFKEWLKRRGAVTAISGNMMFWRV